MSFLGGGGTGVRISDRLRPGELTPIQIQEEETREQQRLMQERTASELNIIRQQFRDPFVFSKSRPRSLSGFLQAESRGPAGARPTLLGF